MYIDLDYDCLCPGLKTRLFVYSYEQLEDLYIYKVFKVITFFVSDF